MRAVFALLVGGILARATPLCQLTREERLLTEEQFTELYFQKEPVLLVGAAAKWATSKWDRLALKERLTSVPRAVKEPTIPDSSGPYTPTPSETDWHSFVDQMKQKGSSELLFANQHSPLMRALHADLDPNTLPVRQIRRSPFFSLGSKRMGTSFHQHDHAWLAQLHGRKLWFLHDGDLSHNKTAESAAFDSCSYHKKPPKDAKNFRRCVASPGDVMYVPITWEHATCSLDDWTLGVGWQGDVSSTPMADQAVLDDDEASLRASFALDKLGMSESVQTTNPALQGAQVTETPAHLAAFTGSVKMLSVLEELGADIHHNNQGMGAPLHTAAGWGHVAAVEWLVKRGMHPDVLQMGSASTPLHYAAAVGHAPVVRWLLRRPASLEGNATRSANRRLQDKEGRTALHYAAANGHEDVVEMLNMGGAGERLLRDSKGMTAEELASKRGHSGVVRRLRASQEGAASVSAEL